MMLFKINSLVVVSSVLLVVEAVLNQDGTSLFSNVTLENKNDKFVNTNNSAEQFTKGLPVPKMFRWFPGHDSLPTDGADASGGGEEDGPSRVAEPKDVKDIDIQNMKFGKAVSMEAVLHDYFTIPPPVEKTESENEQNSPIKPNRARRSTESPTKNNIFSHWGEWMECMTVGCGVEGKQMRTRTCYGSVSGRAHGNVCKYRNMVSFRPCTGAPCPPTNSVKQKVDVVTRYGWSQWTKWSNCSITCGPGGMQRRQRGCMLQVKNKTMQTSSGKCTGEATEKRLCQHSTGCPKWEGWNQWSSCSETCGTGGVIFRTRSCILERYLRSQGYVLEPSNTDNMGHTQIEPKFDEAVNRPQEGVENDFIIVNKDGMTVHIIDAQSTLDINLKSVKEVIDLENGILVKEIVSSAKCESRGEVSEEQKECANVKPCPSVWYAWQAWSDCSATCGSGIGRRERECIHDQDQNPCIGRRYVYRRCYGPPCWGPWVSVGRCSETCGDGMKKRKRKCLMVLSSHLLFSSCEGNSTEYMKCNLKVCPGGQWSKWSTFSECTATCNVGFKHRNRTCGDKECVGEPNELARCNTQPCPAWSEWDDFSCCDVTCGQGFRQRKRKCKSRGVEMEDSLCVGDSVDTEFCYRKPCEGKHEAVLTGQKCGSRSRRNLKNVIKLRIFGGKESNEHDWPWQASWQHRIHAGAEWKHFCGASLIHPRWVVIAGHCIEEAVFFIDHKDPGMLWSIVLGMHELYADGSRYFVDGVYLHAGYVHRTVTKNDIALLKLRQMAKITDSVSPICMPEKSQPIPGESCVITGWGFTEPGGNHSKYLMEASVPIMNFDDCRSLGDYYRYFLDRQIHMCAGNPILTTTDSCTGDSGGPMACQSNKNWYLSAVTSFAFADCGTPGHVGIYTPLIPYEGWIRKMVGQHTYEKCSIKTE